MSKGQEINLRGPDSFCCQNHSRDFVEQSLAWALLVVRELKAVWQQQNVLGGLGCMVVGWVPVSVEWPALKADLFW